MLSKQLQNKGKARRNQITQENKRPNKKLEYTQAIYYNNSMTKKQNKITQKIYQFREINKR